MPVSLDLRKAWKHQRHGDLVVILTWVNDERALVLLPAIRKDAGWYIVQESAAFKWGVDHSDYFIARDARAHAARQSEIACQMLGIEPSKLNRARVIDIISGWVPDLVAMPSAPLPDFKRASYGQMILSADGKPIAGEDLREEVEGVSYG